MVALIVRHDGGGTATISSHRVGEILYGGPALPEWRRLDAALVPYTSAKSASIPNVSVGLDTALSAVSELEKRLLAVEKISKESDRGHDQILTEVRTQMAELSGHVNKTATAIASNSHVALRVARVTNPALVFNQIQQELKLDLSAKGSYNDMKTQMGAASVQGAIETLHTMVRVMSDKITVLQDQIAQLNAEIQFLRNQQS